jgi:hypothetical protein
MPSTLGVITFNPVTFVMRTYLLTSLLLTLLNISCMSNSANFALKDTNWKFVSLKYDSNYSWDTFEIFTNQQIKRMTFTSDNVFAIRNDLKIIRSRYSIISDSIMAIIKDHELSNKLLIRKVTKDTLILYDTRGVTYSFKREDK